MPDTTSPQHSVSVAAVIFDDEEQHVLLIKRRDNGDWEPPGGVLELNESIEDGLRREVLEEAGAKIEVGPLTGVYKNLNRGVVALVFGCRLAGHFQRASAEAAAVDWHSMNRLHDTVRHTFAVRITDATRPGEPNVVSHDGLAPSRRPYS